MSSATQRRGEAAYHISKARKHLMEARKLADGDGETAEHNGTMALVATDDFMDAIVASELLDQEIEAMEKANGKP